MTILANFLAIILLTGCSNMSDARQANHQAIQAGERLKGSVK